MMNGWKAKRRCRRINSIWLNRRHELANSLHTHFPQGEVGVPQTHMYRWIVARGLVALAEGERPEIEYQQVPKVIPPKSEA